MALFFKCIWALLNPANHTWRGIEWALAAHTVAIFPMFRIFYGIKLNAESISYINNRAFPGGAEIYPGPTGYQGILNAKATAPVYEAIFPLSQWLADGLSVGPILTQPLRDFI